MEKYNLLEKWRGSRSPCTAASLLNLSQQAYLELEAHPDRMCLTTDIIFKIQEVTKIPLEALIDYLETPALA